MSKFKVKWANRFYSKRLSSLEELFGVSKPIIGMVHLLPLPGAPAYEGEPIDDVIDFALKEASALIEGGVDGLIVENMWDLPYYVGKDVPPEEIAVQAVAAREVVKFSNVPVGINVIHNGGRVTLAIAKAAGAKFIRVCLLTGALVWDTGEFDHGCAAELLRVRKMLYAEDIRIFADVCKKHAVMFPGINLRTHAIWCDFYMADALIVSGTMTGVPPKVEDVVEVKKAVPERPVILGSGVNLSNVKMLLKYADGAIVGTYFKVNGITQNPVDVSRVKKFMRVVEELRKYIK
ncbi:MAG: photosystem I assembly BtpA [Thermoprotei archaeon]|nr:MAG: photosystem I assembly BtpA [Thermoprotei archaeon]